MPRFYLRGNPNLLVGKADRCKRMMKYWLHEACGGGRIKCSVLANKVNEVELVPDFHEMVWCSVVSRDVWEFVSTAKKQTRFSTRKYWDGFGELWLSSESGALKWHENLSLWATSGMGVYLSLHCWSVWGNTKMILLIQKASENYLKTIYKHLHEWKNLMRTPQM